MLSLKSEHSEGSSSLITTLDSSQELDRWKHLIFAFEMDKDKHSNASSRNIRRSRSASRTSVPPLTANPSQDDTDAALSAEFAALSALAAGRMDSQHAGMPPHPSYPSMSPSPGFYTNFLHHNPWPQQAPQSPPQSPPSSSSFPWPPSPPTQNYQHMQTGPSHYSLPTSNTTPFMGMSYPYQGPSSDAGQEQSPPTTPGGSAIPPSEVEQAIAEEKRRRNTAASARFRVKKKHKTITLERSVSDLSGRAEELEREVADLRRENGWLKEIVMLKGSQFAVNRQQQPHGSADSQASSSRGAPTEAESTGQDSDTEIRSKKDKGKAPDRGERRRD